MSADTPHRTPVAEDLDPDTPHARKVDDSSDRSDEKLDDEGAETHQERLVDEGVEETFPASDPVSVKRIT